MSVLDIRSKNCRDLNTSKRYKSKKKVEENPSLGFKFFIPLYYIGLIFKSRNPFGLISSLLSLIYTYLLFFTRLNYRCYSNYVTSSKNTNLMYFDGRLLKEYTILKKKKKLHILSNKGKE